MFGISVLIINLQNIAKNLIYYKQKLNKYQKICLVVKSNCYGFGEDFCAFFNDYVDYFAVSSLYEYKKIKNKISKPVLILDPVYSYTTICELIKNKCELTVSNILSFELISKISTQLNMSVSIHIAINTGMNRFGFSNEEDIQTLIKTIKKTQNIKIKGIFSHYFDAKNDYYANFQIEKLKHYMSLFELKDIDFPMVHISASDGVVNNNFGDMVRIGYGLYSDCYYRTITLKTKILEIQNIIPMDNVGYSSCYIATKKMKIAIIGIGYGDGIMRNIVKRGYVIVSGKYAKILAVCMDSMIVDVSEIDCNVNDNVIIIGKMGNVSISICDIADWCDTIGYEIIVRISQRVKRVYRGKKKCRLYLENLEQGN